MKSITRYLFLYVSSKFTRKANFRSRFFFFFFFFLVQRFPWPIEFLWETRASYRGWDHESISPAINRSYVMFPARSTVLPSCEWRSNVYHLRINIMRVYFHCIVSIQIFVVLKSVIREWFRFFYVLSPFWKRVNGHRSIDGRFEIIGKQTSSSIVCLYKVLFQFSPVYTIF